MRQTTIRYRLFLLGISLFISQTLFAAADLTPYQPSNWNDKITIDVTALTGDDTHSYTGPYYSNQTLYINFASLNQGNRTARNYTIHLEITGEGGGSWELTDVTTYAYYYTYLDNDFAFGPLAAGSHTFKLWLDYTGAVNESNESNNYYERTITVTALNNAEIHGLKFSDLNSNGVQDSGEPGLPNWQIYLDLNADGAWDNNEPNTLTDANGNYAFTGLTAGSYIVAEVSQSGWQQTYPASSSTSTAAASTITPLAAKSTPATTTTGSTSPIYIQGEIPTPLPDQILPMLAESGNLIGMSTFRSDSRFANINGAGYAAAILDTGIDLNHPFFGSDSNADGVADRIVYQYDFANGDSDASDTNGHGSNVAGIVASQNSTYTGMAPGCNIIALKVFTDAGAGNFAYVENALQWLVSHATEYNLASVNLSLGDSENYTEHTSLYGIGDELAALDALGVMVVVAAGNEFYTIGSLTGVSYPAADPACLAISAVYDSNAGGFSYSSGAIAYTTAADRICPFSQRHPDLTAVFAPGAPITSAYYDGTTVTYHGTSQASPHIAGIAVLAQQLAQNTIGRKLTRSEFVNLLQSSATIINDGDNEDDNVTSTGLNFPRVNMPALAQAILALAIPGTHNIALTTGQVATNINFGNHLMVVGDWLFYPADINTDGYVNLTDLAILTDQWLLAPCDATNTYCAGADIDKNGIVDLIDFQALFTDWLSCTDPQNSACSNLN